MKNTVLIILIGVLTVSCSQKSKLANKVREIAGKEIEAKETPDGTMYVVKYNSLEKPKFEKDARELKEYTDKILEVLPSIELDDVFMNLETLSSTDNTAWETPEINVLLMECTDPMDGDNFF